MISVSHLFENNNFRKGIKSAGKSLVSGSGLILRGTGQAMSTTGDVIHRKFSEKKENQKVKR